MQPTLAADPSVAADGVPISHLAMVLAFLLAVTVVAELVDRAGVFDVAADVAASLSRGRTAIMWGGLVVLASASTIVLSLDTTAVLVTPAVLTLCRRAGLPPLPFAFTTVWLANTASLLLPVSNLTTLLAVRSFPASGSRAAAYVALTWAPALVAILVTALVLAVMFGRGVPRRFHPGRRAPVPDKPLFWLCTGTCAALVPAFVSGVPVLIPAAAAALVLLAAFAVRRRQALSRSLIAWRPVLIAAAMFAVVEVAHALGLGRVLGEVVPAGDSPAALTGVAGVGALAANLVNNLPAYLAVSPSVTADPVRTVALLLGTNLAPLVTPWASLATILWHDRCRRAGVDVPWGSFWWRGAVAAVAVLGAAVATLVVTT